MKLVAATVISLLLASGPALAAGDPAAGEALSANCAACHGAAGISANPDWPNLAGQHAGYLAAQLRDFKAGKERNNAVMAGMVAGLDEQKMDDLAAYYATLPGSVGSADPAKLELGQKIYRGGNMTTGVAACMSCHGPAGKGDPLAGFPSLSGQHATYTATQLYAFAKGERANDPSQMMRNVAAAMSDAEIEAVASYLQGLH